MAKICLLTGLLMTLSACQVTRTKVSLEPSSQPLLARNHNPDTDTILAYRDRWCGVSDKARHQAMENFDQDTVPSRFEQLLIASCEPELYPGKMAIAVKSLQQEGREMPTSVENFTSLLAVFSESQQFHLNEIGKLQKKLDQTIQAISDIEEGISQRKEEVKP
ncbi:hypothetical protein BTA51_12015 [Hahella sp. CCB-MM4]|uniref:hypothetical protein n=1 Tax=Hahella sp. (strain CCB-MM4) TaxID=1926491 RepID=UPI000B9C27D8|nr:hypothetical protein [Hahella sp. CCB-MM4]OZG73202.1 hypothetical protein BTA51_12015 [Hahella sp. CCB-MM4]